MTLFSKKGTLAGTIEITSVPPFRGHDVNLALFPVSDEDSPVPFDGNPPPEGKKDVKELPQVVHFDEDDVSGVIQMPFQLRRPVGWYYLQLNVILYRQQDEKRYAQVERFFFRKRPIEIPSGDNPEITLPVDWPDIPIEELENYGTMTPNQIPE